MQSIFNVCADFMSEAIIIGMFLGVLVRCGNYLIRAVSGKEDIL